MGYGAAEGATTRRRRKGSGAAGAAEPDVTEPELVVKTLAKPPVRKYAKDKGVDISAVRLSREDGVVTRTPTDTERARAERAAPGAIVDVRVREGDRLADVQDRDSYSFELAHVYVGADEDAELEAHFQRVADLLPFAFEGAA